jgi:hypothetical protein
MVLVFSRVQPHDVLIFAAYSSDSLHSIIVMLTAMPSCLCLLGWEKSCFNLSVMYKNGGDAFESCFREGGGISKNDPSVQTNPLPLLLV